MGRDRATVVIRGKQRGRQAWNTTATICPWGVDVYLRNKRIPFLPVLGQFLWCSPGLLRSGPDFPYPPPPPPFCHLVSQCESKPLLHYHRYSSKDICVILSHLLLASHSYHALSSFDILFGQKILIIIGKLGAEGKLLVEIISGFGVGHCEYTLVLVLILYCLNASQIAWALWHTWYVAFFWLPGDGFGSESWKSLLAAFDGWSSGQSPSKFWVGRNSLACSGKYAGSNPGSPANLELRSRKEEKVHLIHLTSWRHVSLFGCRQPLLQNWNYCFPHRKES